MDIRADLLAEQVGGIAERADAARNRARILAAAADLFATRDPRGVTMDDIAKAAGVGRGTLYRRYPDTGTIAVALLDRHERALQEQLLHGEPPLGPGAAPADRLAAFYRAMVDLLDVHAALALGAESGGARFRTGAYGFWSAHVRVLLTEAGVPQPDSLVDVLLAPLAAEVYLHQRERGLASEQIAAALTALAHGVLGPASE
ncbi:TetR/AcrR family transcriptional regulator [Nocardia farcinica]|uniref:TetR/AcrR family transcriptional regulator n=1 Tax=Nocardia farcinica TaxID=37329 RepID=UPI001895BDD5|nr:TetR/AcrR family transcriptional regulator [Nocardia farcinica]MBF6141834.1 helix-turn-helix transcriptional regulator [Nocardia farcinica]MBF6383411.1 helix-turn-helix transcriptional regulator [Nocardia farcinica]MBF6535896.1 helix-turn-helix transcriptional regulator [Nocardia farcinica]